MTLVLPSPISAYFQAANTADTDTVVACFASDAVVTDERRTLRAAEAIRAWREETHRKYRATAKVKAAESDGGDTLVTAEASGNFPGSPVDLRYRFRLAGDRIAALEIG